MDHTTWHERQDVVQISADAHEFDVAYREAGEGEPVTVFLHGIPTWSFLFREVYDAVGHAVLPDLPGYGYTRHHGPGGYDRSVRAQEEYVLAFLDALDLDDVQLVAHDIGGAVALRLAIHTDRVDKLVLSNVTSYDSWPVEFILSAGDPSTVRNATYKQIERQLRELLTDGIYSAERATDEFVDGIIAPFIDPERPVTDLGRDAISTNTNHTLEIAHRHDEIDAQTLLLWGCPGSKQHAGYARQLAESIPDTETKFLDEAYHWVVQDRPNAYHAALDEFLD